MTCRPGDYESQRKGTIALPTSDSRPFRDPAQAQGSGRKGLATCLLDGMAARYLNGSVLLRDALPAFLTARPPPLVSRFDVLQRHGLGGPRGPCMSSSGPVSLARPVSVGWHTLNATLLSIIFVPYCPDVINLALKLKHNSARSALIFRALWTRPNESISRCLAPPGIVLDFLLN